MMRQRPMEGLVDPQAAVALPMILDVEVTPLALEELFAAQSRRLVGALTILTGDAAEAGDLAQEAFGPGSCEPVPPPRPRPV